MLVIVCGSYVGLFLSLLHVCVDTSITNVDTAYIRNVHVQMIYALRHGALVLGIIVIILAEVTMMKEIPTEKSSMTSA